VASSSILSSFERNSFSYHAFAFIGSSSRDLLKTLIASFPRSHAFKKKTFSYHSLCIIRIQRGCFFNAWRALSKLYGVVTPVSDFSRVPWASIPDLYHTKRTSSKGLSAVPCQAGKNSLRTVFSIRYSVLFAPWLLNARVKFSTYHKRPMHLPLYHIR